MGRFGRAWQRKYGRRELPDSVAHLALGTVAVVAHFCTADRPASTHPSSRAQRNRAGSSRVWASDGTPATTTFVSWQMPNTSDFLPVTRAISLPMTTPLRFARGWREPKTPLPNPSLARRCGNASFKYPRIDYPGQARCGGIAGAAGRRPIQGLPYIRPPSSGKVRGKSQKISEWLIP
jgi:hypothetical protein